MALFKNEEQREVEVLNKIEKRIERREKRERLYKIIIGGMAVVAAAAFFIGGHTGSGKHHRR